VKCRSYDYRCYLYCHRASICRKGWLSFWTPAERAGLKAMGMVLGVAYSHDLLAVMGMIVLIRNFVAASRKVKEEGR
jgi:hypothetical protein